MTTEQQASTNEPTADDMFAEMASKKNISNEPASEQPDASQADALIAQDESKEAGTPQNTDAEAAKPFDPESLDDNARQYLSSIQSENSKLQHRINSDSGRLRAYQEKSESLQTQMDEINARLEENKKPAEDDTPNQFATEYPDIARGVDEMLDKKLKQQTSEFNDTIQPIRESQEVTDAERDMERMEADNPGWQEKVSTPEFAQWLDVQPDAVRSLSSSDAVQDASDLIKLFDVHTRANTEPDESEVTRKPNEGKSVTILDKREQQLKDGLTVSSRNNSVKPDSATSSDDPDNLFKFFAKKKIEHNAATGA